MSFDWQSFLEARGIDYKTHGPSTSKDNIYVHCVFCGEADQGFHMGISTKGRGWGCWRDNHHRGIAPARLIQALLGCSWEEAARIAGQKRAGQTSDILSAVQSALGITKQQKEIKPPKLLSAFRPIRYSPKTIYWRYLNEERGYSPNEIDYLSQEFDLHACTFGVRLWNYRIIIPVRDEDNQLITWTGRTIAYDPVRYRTLTSDPDKANAGPLARAAINDGFMRHRRIQEGADFLILVEGPFDCMSVDLHSEDFDAHVDCLFGKVLTASQLDYLAGIRHKYKSVFLVLDPEARIEALRMAKELEALRIEPYLLSGDKDPGDMGERKIKRMLEDMEMCASRYSK